MSKTGGDSATPSARGTRCIIREDVQAWLRYLRHAMERLQGGPPSTAFDRQAPFCLSFDGLWMPDDGAAYLAGWLWDPTGKLEELYLRIPGGAEVPILRRLVRVRRDDVEQFLRREYGESGDGRQGFVAFLDYSALSMTRRSFRLRARLRGSKDVVVARRLSRRDANLEIKYKLLANVDVGFVPEVEPLLADMREILDFRAAAYPAPSGVREVTTFGRQPSDPDVSVIVVLSDQPDVLQAQIASLSADASLRANEFLFVLNSPDAGREFERTCFDLERVYGFPMRLVVPNGPCSQGRAKNLGADHARAAHLLFLGPDVLPRTPGWVQEMREAYDRESALGVLGVKLRKEDETLLSAGLYFSKDGTRGRFWQTLRRFESLPEAYPPANIYQKAPAVDGSCLMLSRECFDAIEGWDETDLPTLAAADLCLKAYRKGLATWYLPRVDLYRLQTSSQDLLGEARGDLFAAWLLTERWNVEIGDLMSTFDRCIASQPWGPAIGLQG